MRRIYLLICLMYKNTVVCIIYVNIFLYKNILYLYLTICTLHNVYCICPYRTGIVAGLSLYMYIAYH
jgi:hypothetical protein